MAVDVDERDVKGRTRLMWAALSGRGDEVEALLDEGADPNLMDENHETPLDLAFRQAEASVSAHVEDDEAMWDVVEGYLDTVKLLLDHGAKPKPGQTFENLDAKLRKLKSNLESAGGGMFH